MKIDLHMHSNISNDGEFSPKELLEMCSSAEINVMALADHNSVRGVKEAAEYGKEKNIKVIPAVELDCTHGEYNLHILGYNIDTNNEVFCKIEKDILEQEISAAEKRMDFAEKIGFIFEREKVKALSPDGTVTGEMIAEIVLADKRNDENILLKPYREGGKRSDNPYVNFYWDWCSKGKPAFVDIKYMTLKEAVSVIKKSSGKAVFAHPCNNIGMNEKVFAEIINEGVEGVEVYSSYHSLEAVEFFKNLAEKYNVFVTCGSDFYGKTKPAIKLGEIMCDGREKEIFNSLL